MKLYNSEIPDLIRLPSNCKGYLDWTTGVIRLNLSHEKYERIYNTKEWEPFQETLLHEMYHGLQIVSSGFLYRFVVELTNNFWIDSLKIGTGDDSIEKLLHKNQANTESIDSVFEYILNNDLGFSIHDMIESATYITHKVMFFPGYDVDDYEMQMRKYGRGGSPYNRLYLVAKKKIGKDAFYFIPGLVHYSLLFAKPKEVIVSMIDQISKNQSVESISDLNAFCNSFVENNRHKYIFIGSPVEIDNLDMHPFYGLQILKLRDRNQKISQTLANPLDISLALYEDCLRPILFNCGEVMYPNDYMLTNIDGLSLEENIETMKSMSVLSMKLFLDREGAILYYKNE